jgi:hypothetical protein
VGRTRGLVVVVGDVEEHWWVS